MANKNDYDLAGPSNREGISRRPRDSRFYHAGDLGPEDYAFNDEEQEYDGRQAYYRSRPPAVQRETRRTEGRETPDRGQGQPRQGRYPAGALPGRREYESDRESARMANQGRENDDEWAQKVRQNWQKGPYRDYGWEAGESVLPEFRDPEVHRTREEEEEERDWRREQGSGLGRRQGRFSYDYDARRTGGMPTGEDRVRYGGGPGYEREGRQPFGPHTGKGPKNYQRSNERIAEDINERLTRHGDIDATEIEVRVENGEVWLTGTAENRQQKRLAEDVADSVAGVHDVHNELRIQQQNR